MNRTLKIAAKATLYYSPNFISKRIHNIFAKRKLKHALEVAHRTKLSQEDILDVLNKFTFDSDIMLHSSLMNIGKIKGGPRAVTKLLLDKIDITKHTLLASALPYRGSFASWLNDDMVFDVRNAPIAMGIVNERIAEIEGACRSIHPTHSVVAIGPKAIDYTCEHHLGNTPFSLYSPYYKLIMNHGKVLLFGTKLNNMTLVHAIEDMLGDFHPYKIYEKKTYDIKCIDHNGNTVIVHTPVHSRFLGLFRDSMRVHDKLIEAGVMQTVPLGESEVSMIDCYGYTLVYLDYIAHGHSIYGSHRVTDKLLRKIDEIKQSLLKTQQDINQ